MSEDPNVHFEQVVLEQIERSPIGAVPNTPTHQDALKRLYAAHQVYAHADHKGGHVTARSLAGRPNFLPSNLDALAAGEIEPTALESNASVYSRYVGSLPAGLRPSAEAHRVAVATRPPQHRHKSHIVHDPLHALFLVTGTGPHHGLPGNYLHGAILEHDTGGGPVSWTVELHDCDDGAAMLDVPTLAAAVEVVSEVVGCAPFHLEELEILGFRMN